MNREQKVALSLVVTTLVAMMASAIAVLVLYQRSGMPQALRGLGFMGISGLGAFSVLIFKTRCLYRAYYFIHKNPLRYQFENC